MPAQRIIMATSGGATAGSSSYRRFMLTASTINIAILCHGELFCTKYLRIDLSRIRFCAPDHAVHVIQV